MEEKWTKQKLDKIYDFALRFFLFYGFALPFFLCQGEKRVFVFLIFYLEKYCL
jgi:hypothetical protein